MRHIRRYRAGFSLIELLVVLAIIMLLVGISLPIFAKVRARAVKVACASNLRQIGLGIEAYLDQNDRVYPTARYMPLPFISSDLNPPLPQLLAPYLQAEQSLAREVYHCRGDLGAVFSRSGSSYMYEISLAGQRIDASFYVRVFGLDASKVPVSRDFDAGVFDIVGGWVTVPPFHDLRNILFADGHVGNF